MPSPYLRLTLEKVPNKHKWYSEGMGGVEKQELGGCSCLVLVRKVLSGCSGEKRDDPESKEVREQCA